MNFPFAFKRLPKRWLATLFIVTLVMVLVVAIEWTRDSRQQQLEYFDADRTVGSENAPIQIVKFMDYQCDQCRLASEYLTLVRKKHPELIRLTIKYFPLQTFNSATSAFFVECAKQQGHFFTYHEAVLQRQDEWAVMIGAEKLFLDLAESMGLDRPLMWACFKSPETRQIVLDDRMLGEMNKITSTPTFFINGDRAVGLKSLQQILDAEISSVVKMSSKALPLE